MGLCYPLPTLSATITAPVYPETGLPPLLGTTKGTRPVIMPALPGRSLSGQTDAVIGRHLLFYSAQRRIRLGAKPFCGKSSGRGGGCTREGPKKCFPEGKVPVFGRVPERSGEPGTPTILFPQTISHLHGRCHFPVGICLALYGECVPSGTQPSPKNIPLGPRRFANEGRSSRAYPFRSSGQKARSPAYVLTGCPHAP